MMNKFLSCQRRLASRLTRSCGRAVERPWIPAFAGMTTVIATFLIAIPTAYAVSDRGVAARQLEGIIHSIHTMQASFNQTIESNQAGVEHSSGSMAVSRPGKFRWEIKEPALQLIVADGKNLSVYDPGLKQITIRPLKESFAETPAAFLSGYDEKFRGYYQVQGGNGHFVLTPRSHHLSFKSIELWFDENRLTHLYLLDQLGQRADLRLSDVFVNKPLDNNLFIIKVPKGIDVIR